MTQPLPGLESAYRAHRGLLFSALGRLAREGYVAPPTESLDLIHDFFVEAWDGVSKRYDPQRASLATYMYSAFVRFARPRIARVQRQRATLIDPHELSDTLAHHAGATVEDWVDAVDLSRVQAAMRALPPTDRALLDGWLNAGRVSERDVARSQGLSRYRVRQRLVDALGRVVTSVGALSDLSPLDRAVAQAMWGSHLSVDETAVRCGITPQVVRNAYGRNQRRMQHAILLVQRAAARNPGSLDMPTSTTPTNFEALIDRVRKRPGDEAVLTEVTVHALGLVKFLESSNDPDALRAWEALDADWLSEVYGALAVGLGETEPSHDSTSALFEADSSDRRRVGEAFEQALLPSLPDGIDELIMKLHPLVPRIDRHGSLSSEPDVRAGGEDAARLSAVGVTPVHLVLACDAIALLIARATSADYLPRGSMVWFDRSEQHVRRITAGQGNHLDRQVLVQEISDMTTLGIRMSEPILDWLVAASPRVSELFMGYTAAESLGNINLTPLPPNHRRGNLFYRWRSTLLSSASSRVDAAGAEQTFGNAA